MPTFYLGTKNHAHRFVTSYLCSLCEYLDCPIVGSVQGCQTTSVLIYSYYRSSLTQVKDQVVLIQSIYIYCSFQGSKPFIHASGSTNILNLYMDFGFFWPLS